MPWLLGLFWPPFELRIVWPWSLGFAADKNEDADERALSEGLPLSLSALKEQDCCRRGRRLGHSHSMAAAEQIEKCVTYCVDLAAGKIEPRGKKVLGLQKDILFLPAAQAHCAVEVNFHLCSGKKVQKQAFVHKGREI